MVTVEESLTVADQYDGRSERTKFEHSVSVPVIDARSKMRTTGVSYVQNMQDFDKRLSKVEVSLSEFRSNHEAVSTKFTDEVTEIKKMLETLSEQTLHFQVFDGLVPHITDFSDKVGNAILHYIFHEGLDADETIVQFEKFHATRMTMKSLGPKQWLQSKEEVLLLDTLLSRTMKHARRKQVDDVASSSNVRNDLALKLVTNPHNTKRDEIIGKSLNLLDINLR
ncbi:unnamed protein product [Ilex paraguariensis]|uniref:Uncharacterized protein n=1 Tax=Ilex paraguariensis TaxID=185542 RepID=A0ABC8SGI5_9AQUA